MLNGTAIVNDRDEPRRRAQVLRLAREDVTKSGIAVEPRHVRREYNKYADWLSNKAMDEAAAQIAVQGYTAGSNRKPGQITLMAGLMTAALKRLTKHKPKALFYMGRSVKVNTLTALGAADHARTGFTRRPVFIGGAHTERVMHEIRDWAARETRTATTMSRRMWLTGLDPRHLYPLNRRSLLSVLPGRGEPEAPV